MPIILTSNIAAAGSYPLMEDINLKGGYVTVANVTARDAIYTLSRKEGMLVYVQDTDIIYKLGSGLTNGDWVEFVTASNLGSGEGLYASKVDSQLRFKSLIAGTNITLTPTGNDITIAASGSLTGPGSSTDKAIPTWNGTSGLALNNSVIRINPAGTITSSTALTLTTDDAVSAVGVSIYPGASTSSNNNGADTIIYGGSPHGTGTPGEIILRGADKNTGSDGGIIRFQSGDGDSASTDGVVRIDKTFTGGRAVRLQFVSDNNNIVSIKAPSAVTTDYTLTLPPDDGNASEFLKTDGNGVLTWSTCINTVQDEGSPISTAVTTLNFTGASVTASGGGATVTVDIPGSTVQDEGSPISTAVTTLNFTGAGVTASGGGATATVNIPGSTVQDEGSPISTAVTTFNFTGAGVTASGGGATATVNIPADVVGPGSSTNTALVTWNGTSGTSVSDNAVILSGQTIQASSGDLIVGGAASSTATKGVNTVRKVTSVLTSNANLTNGSIALVDVTGGDLTFTLPNPAISAGQSIQIINVGGITNNIYVARYATENINGIDDDMLFAADDIGKTAICTSDGTDWYMVLLLTTGISRANPP